MLASAGNVCLCVCVYMCWMTHSEGIGYYVSLWAHMKNSSRSFPIPYFAVLQNAILSFTLLHLKDQAFRVFIHPYIIVKLIVIFWHNYWMQMRLKLKWLLLHLAPLLLFVTSIKNCLLSSSTLNAGRSLALRWSDIDINNKVFF